MAKDETAPANGDEPPIDWSQAKSIANEPIIRRFVEKIGGRLVDKLVSNPEFENADFYFEEADVFVELKVLETEFVDGPEFQKKLASLHQKVELAHGRNALAHRKPKAVEAFGSGILEILRPPLARTAKKASSQLKSTRDNLKRPNAKGILWLVNDNFRGLPPERVVGLMGRILNGSCSGVDGLIYLTNHYIELPDDEFARIAWVPIYRDETDDKLSEFVNWLGKEWFDFVENEEGPVESRLAGDDLSIRGSRVVTSPYRTIRD
ncbi:MAG: hypothetical protein U1E18_06510 [Brevundimonas sp.]|uniref:hypothetical protein n=1 Tax=Brevundimonas sp. TaxID=1871086 RepID=UPI002AB90B7F|nr:hypothetical protein [Brevundimonas sp.]MDZ4109238.1 hypothetical protein [Brevundimonas sp.]